MTELVVAFAVLPVFVLAFVDIDTRASSRRCIVVELARALLLLCVVVLVVVVLVLLVLVQVVGVFLSLFTQECTRVDVRKWQCTVSVLAVGVSPLLS